MLKTKVSILITAIFLGFITVIQGYSVKNLDELFLRDAGTNAFQEIIILKEKNEDLENEIEDLEGILEQLADQNSALVAIDEEIVKYKKLSGDFPIFGPGITVTIAGDIPTPWVIDLVNEFFIIGGEAVDVNGIRISNSTIGFDTLPQGQILLNGSILSSPYVFNVIGETSSLAPAFDSTGGFLDRLESSFPELSIQIEEKEVIQMD